MYEKHGTMVVKNTKTATNVRTTTTTSRWARHIIYNQITTMASQMFSKSLINTAAKYYQKTLARELNKMGM
jgi:hypothetical protein